MLGKIARFFTLLWQDTDGVILPYVTVLLVVIIGVSVLALDGARYMSLQTQLQSKTDALAVAAAAELDRTPSSIERALSAIKRFGASSDDDLKISSIRFLSTLPRRDSDPILPGYVTTDPTRAAFVEVTVEPISMHTILPASIFGGANVVSAKAQAVAGFDQVVCDFNPLYVCNPFEAPGMTYREATEALVNASRDPNQHRLIRLATSRVASPGFGPGDIGYLAPVTGFMPTDSCGPALGAGLGQALAASRPPVCLRLSGVDFQPGDDQIAMDGLNTRFDIYANGFEACKDNYVADVNVRKGYIAPGNSDWCKAAPPSSRWPLADPAASGLPLDENMIVTNRTGTQGIDASVRIGNGTWDCAAYWSIAHSAGPGKTLRPPGCTGAATISRYSVYQYEMNFINDRSPGGEIGDPQCNPLGIKYRRVINAAIINCGSNPSALTNATPAVPVAAFGRFFLTLPAAPSHVLYAEFVGLIQPADRVNHDMVQLYR